MSIKSLLLGTAAALVAVSGARAADAVIAEPEPVEYVRVCDAYGAGFFYIPGTETCLSISGYVRYQLGYEGWDNFGDTLPYNYSGAPGLDGFYNNTRARIIFDARSETELGTLRSYAKIQGELSNAGALASTFILDEGWVEIGGLRMGYNDSAWAQTRNALSSFGSHSDGGLYYAYQQRQIVSYSFATSGVFGTVSLEDDNFAGDGYIPDVVGLLGYEQGWGAVWARAAYDESVDAFAGSLGLHLNVPGLDGDSIRVIGYYADKAALGNAYAASAGVEWSVLGSYYHKFSSTFGASVGAQYLDFDLGGSAYAAELSLVWTPVTNFEVRTEFNYDKADGLDGTPSGFLRFTRFF